MESEKSISSKITPEMLQAGLDAIRFFTGSYPEEMLVKEIYTAMESERLGQTQD